MYIDSLKKNYLPLIAELERKVYPDELIWSEEDFKEEYENNDCYSQSFCGFEKGELVCYIIAYTLPQNSYNEIRRMYISDINCLNPKYLKHLLLRFFDAGKQYKNYIYVADMRKNSYRLLLNQQKRHSGVVKILEQECIEGYYPNGETAYHVSFRVDVVEYLRDDWKSAFQMYIDETRCDTDLNIFLKAFEYLDEPLSLGIDLYEEKNMKFVIRTIKEMLLSYYQMFGDKIPIFFSYNLFARDSDGIGKDAFSKSIASLQACGYKNNEGDKQYLYYGYRNILKVSRKIEVSNTVYRDELSGFRWVRKRILKIGHSRRGGWCVCYDQYGNEHFLLKIPYLSQQKYRYYLKRRIFLNEVWEKFALRYPSQKVCFFNMGIDIFSMLNSGDAEESMRNIADWNKRISRNHFHDWNLIVESLKRAKDILTQGAIKAVLTKSYNQALKMTRNIETVWNIVINNILVQNMFALKAIRKEWSILIRLNRECSEYIKELSGILTIKYNNEFRLSASDGETLNNYIKRMQKYCPTATVYNLHHMFGKTRLSMFIKGKYPCIFKAQEIWPPVAPLKKYVNNLLKTRTKQTMHIYWDLSKKDLLSGLMECVLNREQYKEVLQILKYHNVWVEDETIRKQHEFRTLVEKKCSPEFLVAGDASVCCMRFGNANAIDYAREEGFGIINVYYKDRIIANALIWINEVFHCLILGNIEVHPNYMKFEELLKNCFRSVALQLMEQHGLDCVMQGTRYNDLELYTKETPEIYFERMEPVGVKISGFYSDAQISKVIEGQISGCVSDPNFDRDF